jgi:flagellar biosynthetic protein FliR
MRVRALLAITISLCIVPLVATKSGGVPVTLIELVSRLAMEMMLGLMLGTAALIIVNALQAGATIVSNLAGMDLAESADPISGESSSVINQLLGWLAVAIYLSVGGHRQLMASCIDSFSVYAAGEVAAEEYWLLHAGSLVQHSLSIGIRAAAPMGVALFLANLVSALLGRTLPQLNIMAIGFSINSIVLLSTMMLTIGSVGWVFESEIVAWIEMTAELFSSESRNV